MRYEETPVESLSLSIFLGAIIGILVTAIVLAACGVPA